MQRSFFIDEPAGLERGPLAGALVILWHGAGGDVDERTLLQVAHAFVEKGAYSARARFPYRLAGRRAPDRMPVLVESAKETIAEIRGALGGGPEKLILGGRSMGGRVASMLAAEGQVAHGLLFLSYPLHPAGQPSKLRDAHLPAIPCPMLFVQGDRDALCDPVLLEPVLARIGARATLAMFPGADHSMRKVPAEEIARVAVEWAGAIVSRTLPGPA